MAFGGSVDAHTQVIEYMFGDLKRLCSVIAKNELKLGARFQDIHVRAKRIENLWIVCWGLYQAVTNAKVNLHSSNTDFPAILPTQAFAVDINRPQSVAISASAKVALAQVPQLTRDGIASFFDGHWRDYKRGTGTTNLLFKGCNLVRGHHVLGVRWKRRGSEVWLVFVVIASYRRGTYHTCMRVTGDPNNIYSDSYCTCFIGEGTCIHKAS